MAGNERLAPLPVCGDVELLAPAGLAELVALVTEADELDAVAAVDELAVGTVARCT